MTEVASHFPGACSCAPFPGPAEGDVCKPCSPNMTVTCEEVGILSHMRDMKHEARAVQAQLKDIRKTMEKSVEHVTGSELAAEFEELSKQLETLRHNWREWEHKLQEAIERKLVLLGHREAKGQ
jgi:hypothetical protein